MAEPIDVDAAHAAVAGTDFEVLYTVVPGDVDGGGLLPQQLMADGRAVALRVPADASDGGPWLTAPMSVGVLDGGAFTPFATAAPIEGDHPRQAFDLSVADGVTAWLESDSTDVGTSRWRVFTAGRDGRTTLVARAEEVGGGATSTAGSTALWRGRVYWAAGEPGRTDVFSRAADGNGPVVSDATGASQPVAAGSGVAVVRSELVDPALAPGEAHVDLLVDGQEARSIVRWSGDPGSSVAELVADGDVLAFVTITSTQTGGRLYLLDTAAGTARVVALRGSGREASVALCDGRLQWSEADAQGLRASAPTYVLDVTSGDLASIDVDHAYTGAMCGGGHLAWRQLDAAAGPLASTVVARWNR